MQDKEQLTKAIASDECLRIVQTNDGSSTIFHPEIGEHYHSHHGALQESRHVFLNSGLQFFLSKKQENKEIVEAVSILEVGFGTGLNYLLTADFCFKNRVALHYTGIERYPLSSELIAQTGYSGYIDENLAHHFYSNYERLLNDSSKEIKNMDGDSLKIAIGDALQFDSSRRFDVLYFDAFSAIHQPEMWTKELLAHVCNFLKPGGVFITYAITGNLKRIMKSLGFQIEKVPGAPGKREMLRAISPL